ncbi:alpha/beta fold hydrolase [Rhizobium sp. CRIBSB]|nr:alpha/beta fold hydrolase [Rhizobium sp. CRIBSB]
MSSRIVNANGLAMFIEEQGEGPVVLFAHGFPETSYAWRHQLSALAAAGYHAVAPDMRGYGATDAPSEINRYSTFDLVGDLVGLLDALGCENAILVGNDWGSTVAWQAALLRPDRFKGVVAIGVPMMGSPPVPPTALFPQTDDALFYPLYFQEPGIAEAEFERDVEATLRKILFAASREAGPRQPGDGTPNPFSMVSRNLGLLGPLPIPDRLPAWLSEADLAHYVEAFARSGFRGGLNYYRNLDANWSHQRALNGLKVKVPALYMVGEQDVGLSIPGMREIIEAMPGDVPGLTQCITIPDCGHWAPQEKPEEVSKAILEFARSIHDKA